MAKVALNLGSRHRLTQVRDQIDRIFEAYGKPRHAIRDAHDAARLGADVAMGGGGGMDDQRLGVAQVMF